MPFKSYRDESRVNYGKTISDGDTLLRQDLEFGCMLRIADATEAMAKNHIALMEDRDRYKLWYDEKRKQLARRDATIRSLRGHITRLKRKLAELGK